MTSSAWASSVGGVKLPINDRRGRLHALNRSHQRAQPPGCGRSAQRARYTVLILFAVSAASVTPSRVTVLLG